MQAAGTDMVSLWSVIHTRAGNFRPQLDYQCSSLHDKDVCCFPNTWSTATIEFAKKLLKPQIKSIASSLVTWSLIRLFPGNEDLCHVNCSTDGVSSPIFKFHDHAVLVA